MSLSAMFFGLPNRVAQTDKAVEARLETDRENEKRGN